MIIKGLITFGGFVTILFGAFLALTPEKISELRFDYLLFLFSRYYMEVFFLILVSLMVVKKGFLFEAIRKFRISLVQSYSDETGYNRSLLVFLLLLLVFLVFYSFNLSYYIVKNKYYYMGNLSLNDYKYSIINKANIFLDEGRINDAKNEFDKIKLYYPNSIEAKSLAITTKKLEGDTQYAAQLFENYRNGVLNRKSMTMLAESARLQPTNKIVASTFNTNYKKLMTAFEEYKNVKLECLDNGVSSTLIKNSSYYLDQSLVAIIDDNELCGVMKGGEISFLEKAKKSWSVGYLKKVYSFTDLKSVERISLYN